MYKFQSKMTMQVQFNGDFARKKSIDSSGIRTHNLQTRVVLPGRYLPSSDIRLNEVRV